MLSCRQPKTATEVMILKRLQSRTQKDKRSANSNQHASGKTAEPSNKTHILVVIDCQPADEKPVGDSRRGWEDVEVKSVDSCYQVLAQMECVELEIQLEKCDNDLKHGCLFPGIACREGRNSRLSMCRLRR